MDLLLALDPVRGRRAGLEEALRASIRSGRLVGGTPLPSTRVLARDLGMSRATVVAAYEQLTAEGYLLARQGSGTSVAAVSPVEPPAVNPAGIETATAHDFRPGAPDASLFPRSAWLRSVRSVIAGAPDSLFDYGDPQGRPELRRVAAEYLGRSRAVATDGDGVSVFGGYFSAAGFLAEVFASRGIERVAVEDPSLFIVRDLLSVKGLAVEGVPVDDEGISVDGLAGLDVGAVFVTPSHQYPLGVAMSADRRAALIAWARDSGAWIVEDDYDSEFRYDRQPIGSLQGLAPDRVIYAGTISKTLSPALRLAWLVVPPELRRRLARIKHLRAGVSSIDQLALAEFVERGDLDRHIRRVRAIYEGRRAALAQRLIDDVGWLAPAPASAGLHLTAFSGQDDGPDIGAVVRVAAEASIGLLSLDSHYVGPSRRSGLVLGYSRPPQHRFAEALDRLVELLAGFDR